MKLTIEKAELIEMFVTMKERLDRLEHKLDAVMSGLIDDEIENIVKGRMDSIEELRPYSFSQDFPLPMLAESENQCLPTPENLCLYQAIETIDITDVEEPIYCRGVVDF